MLFPQIWAYLSTRRAVAATIIVTAGLAVTAIGRAGWDRQAVGEVLPSTLLQLCLALLLGLFITGVIDQAERRAALIEELERTRSELAETEHARGVLRRAGKAGPGDPRHAGPELHQHSHLEPGHRGRVASRCHDCAQAVGTDRTDHPGGPGRGESSGRSARTGRLLDASLAEAVQRVVARFGDETGLPARVTVTGRPRSLPANYQVVLLRATQEALANVRKHADAKTVRVTLTFPPDGPGSATLEVADDGQGFDPLHVSGYGLRGMQSRVEQMGGTLEITSTAGVGTSIRVLVP
jgi:hypothetical protein